MTVNLPAVRAMDKSCPIMIISHSACTRAHPTCVCLRLQRLQVLGDWSVLVEADMLSTFIREMKRERERVCVCVSDRVNSPWVA